MSFDAPTVGIGVAVMAFGVDWRVRVLRRRRSALRERLHRALRDPDLAVRRAAALLSIQHGLSTVAEILLDAIKEEEDASVLDRIAEAVARNQWEPSDRAQVFELRLWAQRRLDDRAERQPEARVYAERQPVLSAAANGRGETAEAARKAHLVPVSGTPLRDDRESGLAPREQSYRFGRPR